MKNICPLTGQPCLKKKLIHITDIAQGKAETKNFCLDCASDYVNGVSEEVKAIQNKKLVDEFVNFLTIGTLPKKINAVYPDKHCSNCRTSLEHIAKSGKLGCSQCYDTFKEELKPLLITSQFGLKHVGKVPEQWKNTQKQVELEYRMMESELKMQEAIVDEKYEEAAEYRDELAKLKPIWERKKELAEELASALSEGEFEAAQKIKEEIEDLLRGL